MALSDVRPKTLIKVIDYLEQELGLEVIGSNIDSETGYYYGGLRSFNADEVIQLRKFYMQGHEFEEFPGNL